MFVIFACVLVGCAEETPSAKKEPAAARTELVLANKVKVGKNVFLEIQGDRRRVLVEAYVSLREGALEQLLTRKRTKEHEAILAADADARDIHAALIAAGAEPGMPVRFQPEFQPPSGTVIRVSLVYEAKGKKIEVPARTWIRDRKKGTDLDQDWVFSGSMLIADPFEKTNKPHYAANDGDVICVTNFESAMLDLAVQTSKDYSDLSFEAYTERIPPLETPVLVILEPVKNK